MTKKYIILFNNKVTVTYLVDEILSNPNIIISFLAKDIAKGISVSLINEKVVLDVTKNNFITVSLNGKTAPDIISLTHNDLITLKHQTNMCYMMYFEVTDKIRCSFIKIAEGDALLIGRGNQNNINIEHPAVLEKHAEIRNSAGSLLLKTASNSYTYVNSLLNGNIQLNIGDYVQIMSCVIYNLGTYICVIGEYKTNHIACLIPQIQQNNNPSVISFTPVPRIYRSTDSEQFVIDPPPAVNHRKPIPFLLSAGPSLTMSLAMLVSTAVSVGNVVNSGINGTFITSSFMAMSMLAGALLWPWLMRRYNEEQDAQAEQLRTTKYKVYLNRKEEEIQQIYDHNRDVIAKYQLPSIEQLCTAFDSTVTARFLWERNTEDIDFLSVRLGCGNRKSDITVQTTEHRFSVDDDPLSDIPEQIANKFSEYESAPLALSLYENNITGLFGRVSYTDILIRNIISNIILLHSPENIRTAFIFNDITQAVKYNYLADIPHVWNREKNRRFFTMTEAETDVTLTYIYNQVNIPVGSTINVSDEHYVIFVWENRDVENTALYQYIKANPASKRVSFIFIADGYANLPQDCMAVVQCSKDLYGVYVKNQNDNRLITFQPDACDVSKLQAVIQKLNALSVDSAVSNDVLPTRVGFLDLFKVGNVKDLTIAQRWKHSNSHSSLATPIGSIKGGDIIQFDIHEAFHGCHGIVAGTTGSGKSEFLQAYILSMMVNYGPEDVNFVLIDFKGGDIATPFLGLPHLSAVISNLSKNILYRAMVSLEAEQIKRQKLFDEKKKELNIDKIDINSYQKLFHSGVVDEPLPHLIIIMDEFAQFKTQHSEYMQKLINIAQIGRSLGIHLILATQKPAGVVDGQIWSNSRFKFCLKVLEREDSKAVLQRDEAAFIKNPGTGYMQVGYNEIFSQFQSGYCRTKYIPYDDYYNFDDLTIKLIDNSGNVIAEEIDIDAEIGSKAQTQISAVVEELRRVSDIYGYSSTPLWLPELPKYVYTDDCDTLECTDSLELLLGLMDIPSEQKQIWHTHHFIKDGNIAIYGASGTGKTTFAQSLLYQAVCKFTPTQFKYGIIDVNGKSYSSFVNTLYDIGSVMGGDDEKLDLLFNKLEQELAYRKDMFAEMGFNSFAELYQNAPDKLPIIVIVLENYAKFREMAYGYEERVIDAVSSGQAYGIYFIITTNSKSGIYYKVREQLTKTITFNMLDSESYRDILGVRIDIEPENIKGRALVIYNDQAVELQIALPIMEESENKRVQTIKDKLQQYRSKSEVKNVININDDIHTTENTVDASAAQKPIIKTQNNFVSSPKTSTSMSLGFDSKKHTELFADMKLHKQIFICSEHPHDFTDIITKVIPLDTECKQWVLTGKEEDAQKEVLADIEKSISKDILPVVIIPDFISLYNDISNENLDKLCWFIKNHYEPVYITCSCLEGFQDYCDTSLHASLCKRASVVLFTNGILSDKYANMLNNYTHRIDKFVREKQYTGNQYLISVDETYTTTYFREV